MDNLARQTLASLRGPGGSVEVKLKHLTELKAEIKHRHCPENAIGPIFEVIRIALATPHLTDAGFSILGHLIKRLELQDQALVLQAQGAKTYNVLLERLADQKDRIRQRAIQALTDFHAVSPSDVELFVRDNVLISRSPRAKEAGMQWVATTRREKNIAFRSFVPPIVDCLEDADGSVRQSAQATVIDLFRNANTRGTNDLQKHLQQRGVRKSIVEHILSELGLNNSVGMEPPSPVEKQGGDAAKQHKSTGGGAAGDAYQLPIEAPPMSVSEQEAVQLDPIYVESSRSLEEAFREMHPYFEGKETEQNWLKREKSIIKMRKMTKGNAPQNFTTTYLACIKGLLDGILKTVNSLRTTLCTISCQLIQELAKTLGPGLDNMVEILLQNLIKLCASTKKLAAAKSNDTVTAIMASVSYNIRLVQHVHIACQDKNQQPRSFACGWLKVIINKHGHYKSAIEHNGGLELIEKCLKAGLYDRDPNVRQNMRPTYWAFAQRWPEKSESIMSNLDERNQKALMNDSANPHPDQKWQPSNATAAGKPTFSQSTASVPARPTIKETIAAQKKAVKAASRNLPSRPGSAEPFGSPKKSASQMNMARPATAMSTASRNVSTTSVGTLSSAPVRPRRRADQARPATADPNTNKKPARTETPPRSPATSPIKRPRTPAPTTNAVKLAPKKADSPAAHSPVKAASTVNRRGMPNDLPLNDVVQPQLSPTKAAEDFTMVLPTLGSSRHTELDPPNQSPQVVRPTSSPGNAKLDDPFSPEPPNSANRPKSPEKFVDSNGTRMADQQARLSPTKLAGDIARLSYNETPNQRISMSPRTIGSRKETLGQRNTFAQDQQPLEVYEDPVHESPNDCPYPPPLIHTPRALEELPVNEPVKNRQALDHRLLAEEPQSPGYHQKWLALEAAERRRPTSSENIENPRMARKILDSGIDRLKAKTLDAHGFRKLQALIRTAEDAIWEDGYKFDELIMPLLEYLEIPSEVITPRSGKAQDSKTQDLVTIRMLLQHQPKHFPGYYPRVLIALVTARKYYTSTSHIVCGLEETAETVVAQCDPVPCIDSILDLLEEQTSKPDQIPSTSMAFYVLAGLLHCVQEKGQSIQLSDGQETRLGDTGAKYLMDTNPDIRRAVIEFVLELYDTVNPERFWSLVGGEGNDHRSLITYYLARKRAATQ
ncbi:suppressor of tub2 mutation [Lecanora helva]